MQGSNSTYNTVTIIFLGLSAFVCLCSLLLLLDIVQPPGAFAPFERDVPSTIFLPSDTPTFTPTETPTITRTPTPTRTPIVVPTLTPRS